MIGVDPGNQGAIACWASPDRLLWVRPLVGGKLTPEIVALIQASGSKVAIVEEPTYDPARSGHNSAKTQHENVGRALGVLEALGLRVLRPTAQTWRKLTGTSGANKRVRDDKGRVWIKHKTGRAGLTSGEMDAAQIGWSGFYLDRRA